jgi:hypothetical protein
MTARILHFLLAWTISIGLAVAPLASPLAAAAHQASDAGEMHDMMQMADMSADMPCCPDKQKQGDCQDCPLLAICMAKLLQNVPVANGLPIHESKSRTLRPLDEPVLAGLARPPPDQPPRMLV